MIPIEVSPEVFVALHRAASSPEETPDDVLRRVLAVEAPTTSPAPATTRTATTTAPPVARTRGPLELTPQATFRPFIVASLRRRGGEAHLSHVLEDVEAEMGHLLTEADREVVDKDEIRWENAVRWERKAMADEGLIDRTASRGFWRLTFS